MSVFLIAALTAISVAQVAYVLARDPVRAHVDVRRD